MAISSGDSFYLFGLQLDGRGGSQRRFDVPEESRGANGTVWHHIDYSKPGAEECLRELGLGDAVVDGLLRTDTRPRVVVRSDGVLISLRGINLNPGAEPDDMVSLRLWLQADRVVTVRQRRLMAVQDVQAQLQQGMGPQSSVAIVVDIIERLVDRIADFVDSVDVQADVIEDRVQACVDTQVRSDLSVLRRQVASVRRYLAPQREALDALSRLQNNVLEPGHQQQVRELSDRVMRYVEDLDLVREHILVAQEEVRNAVAEQQNARTYVLSVVAAIFLPITFITGVFGMNVAGLPGVENPEAFAWVFFAMLGITVGIGALFRWRSWF